MQLTPIDFEDSDQVITLYNKIKHALRHELSDYTLLPDTLEENELISEGFVKFDGKFFHPGLMVRDKTHAKLLFKLGNLENIERDITGIKISNLIYKRDKHAEIRGISDTSYDVLSTFKSMIEIDKTYNKKRIRENGTHKGALIYKTLKTIENKNKNQLYLKAHQHGPANTDLDLVCHVRGTPLFGRTMTNFETGAEIFVLDNQFHHILYEGKKSIYKSNEPSYHFGKSSFVDWPHSVHVEFFGCITLSGDAHDAVHNSNPNYDSIDHWFKRKLKGECLFLPYLWQSEENYNTFCKWLEQNTRHFKFANAPTYNDFIKSQSTVQLKRLSTISPGLDLSVSTRTDPSVQISTSCNQGIDQSQNLDLQDTLPSALSC